MKPKPITEAVDLMKKPSNMLKPVFIKPVSVEELIWDYYPSLIDHLIIYHVKGKAEIF